VSVFTRLSTTEVNAFLKQYNCGDLTGITGIIEGVTNSNYRLTSSSGNFILTVYEQLDELTLNTLHRLQNHLHKHGLHCARVIKNNQGNTFSKLQDKPVALLEQLDGSIAYPISNQLCQQVGLTLARIHLSPAMDDFDRPNPRGFDWLFATARSLINDLPAEDQAILQQELEFLSRFSSLALPAGSIHADLFPDNVLVRDNSISGIIDFDFACNEVYLFDICVAINAWCNKNRGELDRIRMRDLLSAYSSLRPLNQEENLALPMMLRATALRFWLSRLYDHHYVEKKESIQYKDPDEFKRILLNRRKRLSGMQR